MSDIPIAAARQVVKTFSLAGRRGGAHTLYALKGVSFEIARGATLGLVGESGSGKSTIGRILVGLIPPTGGEVALFGQAITGEGGAARLAALRRRLQFVFQDPFGSLDPRMRVGDSIAEPLDVMGGWTRHDRAARIAELLQMVGLPRSSAERFPHEFSGGQRQRIGIARALALRPEFIVCDEPVSALDVSMQAQIVNLLLDLQEQFGLSYLFIAHDLAVVRSIATEVAVLYSGTLMEIAAKGDLYRSPKHPYTQALLEAVPRPDPDRKRPAAIAGEIPSVVSPPQGCVFHARCPYASDLCREKRPELREIAPGHRIACHLEEGAPMGARA